MNSSDAATLPRSGSRVFALIQHPTSAARIRYCNGMDTEKTIAEIEMLEQILSLPDKRPLRMSDWKAANQKHDEKYANDPWFRLWKRDGE